MQQHVFAPEREEEEIRALWKTAHQRVLLDETWLSAVLTRPSVLPAPVKEAGSAAVVKASPAPVQLSPQAETPVAHAGAEPAASLRIDWVGALDVSHFAGREVEVAELSEWIMQERCPVVTLLGMGGIGKSTLNASRQALRNNGTRGKSMWKIEEKEGTYDSPDHFTPSRYSNPCRVASPF